MKSLNHQTSILSFEIVKLYFQLKTNYDKCKENTNRIRNQVHTAPSDNKLTK
jgi:hypothetical protein